jgi:hypothetical protein
MLLRFPRDAPRLETAEFDADKIGLPFCCKPGVQRVGNEFPQRFRLLLPGFPVAPLAGFLPQAVRRHVPRREHHVAVEILLVAVLPRLMDVEIYRHGGHPHQIPGNDPRRLQPARLRQLGGKGEHQIPCGLGLRLVLLRAFILVLLPKLGGVPEFRAVFRPFRRSLRQHDFGGLQPLLPAVIVRPALALALDHATGAISSRRRRRALTLAAAADAVNACREFEDTTTPASRRRAKPAPKTLKSAPFLGRASAPKDAPPSSGARRRRTCPAQRRTART